MPDRWSWPSGSGNFWALWPSPACGSLQRPLCVLPIEDPNQPSLQVGDHDGPHSPLVHPLDQGSSDSLGRIVVGPISMASSAVASGLSSSAWPRRRPSTIILGSGDLAQT